MNPVQELWSMEAGLSPLEPKRGQAFLCIRTSIPGQICQHLGQQKEFHQGELFRGTGCGWVSVAWAFLSSSWSAENKNKLISLSKNITYTWDYPNPRVAWDPLRVLSLSITIIKCLKTFSNPTLNVLSQNEDVEPTITTYGREFS